MKNLTLKGLLIFVVVVFSLTGCKKEEGPQGPPGKDGNANVKTAIIKVFGYEWEQSGSLYIVDKPSDLLTQDIIDNGSAHLYVEVGEGMWTALPYSTMGFGVGVNDLGIWTEGSSVTSQTTIFKLVVIQGQMQNKNINFNDYTAVKNYYKIKD